MKKFTYLVITILLLSFTVSAIPPYYKLEVRSGDIAGMTAIIKQKLEAGGFRVIGEYNPGGMDHLYVIAFTSDELTALSLGVPDRGALASVLKVGITLYDGKVTASVINPEYFFNAYFRDNMNDPSLKSATANLTENVIAALKFETTVPTGFGGDESIKKLRKYHYMVGMPYFDDPVELGSFSSFEEGLKIISDNLSEGKGNTVKVYENIIDGKKVAVFGIGLLEKEKGEAHFLPIIGEDHIAAMPYEIILQDTQATMLHGRFRFALHWPELKMITFTKIMSSPGAVEDFMKALVE